MLHQSFLAVLDRAGLPYGQEASFKLEPSSLLANRMLVGLRCRDLDAGTAFGLAKLLDMPESCQAPLAAGLVRANAIFFGIEERPTGAVCKMYLEFWDAVRAHVVGTGDREPQLLHLGVKWIAGSKDRHEVARYHCHPLLSARDVLRRMSAITDGSRPYGRAASDIVLLGLRQAPQASLLYEEVTEDGNPRRSFDVNVYKTGLRMHQVMARLGEAAEQLGVSRRALENAWAGSEQAFLGHMSAGTSREGSEFLSVYWELKPLPPIDVGDAQTTTAP
jgi:hypothetical protein